jgi:NifU-like protein involved in Fe-S cluster formation
MVGPKLRAVLLASVGAGALTGDDVRTGSAEHPVCGDRTEVDVRLVDGRIAELRWRASGCPATQAVAATAAQAVIGSRPCDAAVSLRAQLVALGDLASYERHAEAMFLRALAAACRSY